MNDYYERYEDSLVLMIGKPFQNAGVSICRRIVCLEPGQRRLQRTSPRLHRPDQGEHPISNYLVTN